MEVVRVERDRLLDQGVLSGLGRQHRLQAVPLVRCAQGDGVDIRLSQQLFELVEDRHLQPHFARLALGPFPVRLPIATIRARGSCRYAWMCAVATDPAPWIATPT